MKKWITGMSAAAMLLVAVTGVAGSYQSADEGDSFWYNVNSAFYMSGDVGYGKVMFQKVGTSAYSKFDNSDFAFIVALGYQFNHYLSAEFGYTSFPTSEISSSSVVGGPDANIRIYGLDWALKGSLPINQQVDLFAKAGLIRMQSEGHQTGSAISTSSITRYTGEFGLGVAYNIDESLSFTAQGIATLSRIKNGAKLPATYVAYVGANYKWPV